VQQTLILAGFWTGPVDGEWPPALTEALKAFQTDLGVPATGTVDAVTIAALERAIRQLDEPEASPSATPSEDDAADEDVEPSEGESSSSSQ
jgi:peptidoglycan hydrolase-like protein with peptidoglycan-binding domain